MYRLRCFVRFLPGVRPHTHTATHPVSTFQQTNVPVTSQAPSSFCRFITSTLARASSQEQASTRIISRSSLSLHAPCTPFLAWIGVGLIDVCVWGGGVSRSRGHLPVEARRPCTYIHTRTPTQQPRNPYAPGGRAVRCSGDGSGVGAHAHRPSASQWRPRPAAAGCPPPAAARPTARTHA